MSLFIFDRSRQIAGKENANELNNTNGHTCRPQTDSVRSNIVPELGHTAHWEHRRGIEFAVESAHSARNFRAAGHGNQALIWVHLHPVFIRFQAAAFELKGERGTEGWSGICCGVTNA